jgi:nitrous oxidase accessory protein
MRMAGHMLVAALAAISACHEARGMSDGGQRRVVVDRPEGCIEVAAGAPIQVILDDPAVAAVCLAPGLHQGPLRLDRRVTLWGPPDAVLRGHDGTLVEVAAPHAEVLGLTLDGTGGKFDRLDGAVRITADDTRVEGVRVINAVFGILVERASRVRVLGNHVEGSQDPATGLRGDTIRLWETRDSLVADNHVEDGRDVVVWYSRGNTLRGNRIERARYGMHFMYTHDNRVEGNQLLRGVVGVFVMYSRDMHLTGNLIADAAGSAGMAIGIKDSGNIHVDGNALIHNTLGIYIDSSPMQRGDVVVLANNVLRLNDAAVVFHSSAHDVEIRDNDLADNQVQVRVDGGGDATAVLWRGNYFDDYTGYDLDDDVVGDVPYELRSLSNDLTASHPGLALFRGMPALALVDAAAHLDPLYQPHPVLVDRTPRMAPRHDLAAFERHP